MTKTSPIWHPLTQHAISGPAVNIDRAEGALLYTREGKKLIDGISSWWVNTHGHCHPKIVEAVQAQAAKLDQIIFAGYTHEPAEKLARKLIQTAQKSIGPWLDYVFFSDSGSTSVEVALKMAIGYHAHKGKKRQKIVALEGAYHGDTFGTMAAGARGVFNQMYEPFLFDVVHLPFPEAGEEQKTLQAYEQLLIAEGQDVAAFIFEPMVQGAAGMKMYSGETLRILADFSKRYGVLTIADEVMTGFGRTGTMFACERAGFAPDIMCLSKGLTGGFLPMGATLCNEEIYHAFYNRDRGKMFFHSTSFTANPMACAAALASLEIWDEEPVMQSINNIEQSHMKAGGWFSARPDVAQVRVLGSVFALDIRTNERGYLSDVAPFMSRELLRQGVLLRPIGNTVYILPPYCITNEQLERIYDSIWQSLDRLRDERGQRAA